MNSKPLTGLHLKLIACAAMLTDHACKVLIHGTFAAKYLSGSVGRIAFPLFAYLLLEGFLHTKNRMKYARNLLVIAVISEAFFDYALHGKWFYLQAQNTCFTLLLGLLLFIVLEKCETAGKPLLMLPAAALFACAFYFGRVDYGLAACGVFLVLYLCRYQAPWFAALLTATVLLAAYRTFGAYLAVIPLFFYGRERGRIPSAAKYLFYAFYPAHLAVLASVRLFDAL